ncbi:hypothetical protein FW774_17920 [Pedobacter sp. BS3]|uniref:AGE family epimerase/isomerase n=1 Tax=Pedobacter sp. BS3 TaxID=2567937 RepID=UPI0011F04592|nr:AGE family epimerase/isomerase [Pedobacter sp. BS3]TZF81441.1 hypothetical protein FW774_17920 [Pedobacter sp. BS3]
MQLLPKLAGLTPGELLEQYKKYLFDDFLPFMDQYIIDHEYGGFMCNTDRAGNNITTNKRTWFDGRGIWVYSFLYNHIDKNIKYLDIVQKTVELVMKIKLPDEPFWPWSYTRTGELLDEHTPDIYGNLFIAGGFIEYAQATGKEEYTDKAKEIILRCVEIYDSENYVYDFDYRSDVPTIKAARVLGHWMILLNLSTSLLKQQPDEQIKTLTDRCIEALLNKHLNKEFNLMIEFLNHDLSIPDGSLSQFVYIGHAIEALWMIMDEAIRRKDCTLFDQSSALFKRHVEVAWDDVYGGVFHCLESVEQNKWLLEKVLWAQHEVLVGLLLLISHSSDAWAYRWFDKVYTYVINNYPLKKYGYALWNIGGDRKMTFQEEGTRIENYHHPRFLMLGITQLERMIREV